MEDGPEKPATTRRRGNPKGWHSPEHEEYWALLLRFEEFCSRRGMGFQEGMRRALYAAMAEPTRPPPVSKRGPKGPRKAC